LPLTAGSRLGPYEILAPIGAGGGFGLRVVADGNAWAYSYGSVLSDLFVADGLK